MKPPFYHVIMITLPDDFVSTDVDVQTFEGGRYTSVVTDIAHLGAAWMSMEKWRKDYKIKPGKAHWVEQWTLHGWDFPCDKIQIFYPIS